jgi:hypothetical protein
MSSAMRFIEEFARPGNGKQDSRESRVLIVGCFDYRNYRGNADSGFLASDVDPVSAFTKDIHYAK